MGIHFRSAVICRISAGPDADMPHLLLVWVPGSRRNAGSEAAVHYVCGPGDVTGFVTREERDDVGNLFGGAVTRQWNKSRECIPGIGRICRRDHVLDIVH